MRVDKRKLLEFIKEHEPVTFTDIEEYFTSCGVDFKGDTGILLSKSRLVAWNGWNKKASRAFMDLVSEGAVTMYRVSMSEAPMPPAFRAMKRLSVMNYVPIIIKTEKG